MSRPALFPTAFVAALVMTCPSWADLAGPLDFETAGQLGANFRATLNGGNASQATDSGGYVALNGSQNAWIGIYDTTPGNNADASQTFAGKITIHLDISAANATASFGIFLFDDSNRSGNNLLTILNVDTAPGGTTEQIRFWKDSTLTDLAVTNLYSSTFISGTNGSADAGTNSWLSNAGSSGQTIDTTAPFTFTSLDFTYDPAAGTLLVATPNFSATLAIPGADIITNPGIAIRINDPGTDAGTQKFDNFGVVPEPGTAALLLIGLGICARRRRK